MASSAMKWLAIPMAENEKHPGWGGRRANQTGRPRTSPDGTLRVQHSLRASASEWEIIKDFARILKHRPERAEKMVRELKELEN